MTLRYLLDTNTVSYSIQGKFLLVRAKLDSIPADEIGLSCFTLAELVYGLARPPGALRLRLEVEGFLKSFQILPWDASAATIYGEVRAEQERKGRRVSHEDLMLASHALSLGLTLVTHDRAFSFIDGLRIQDWTAH
ncbi:MAG TPA: type II toxin-antitoxin system VapC family toxin [Terracidiphilus sp.]|jgi:tRNA(fMet)-specific endonuclease VapC|nr:type II toxin-antitoxin system VapC family toxin [Terracidiphilus sp.]